MVISMKTRMGIDIGKVIIGGIGEQDTSFFTDEFLSTPAVPNAFEAVRKLSKIYDVWFVSKCGQKVQEKTIQWLTHHRFHEITGTNPEQIVFCRKRSQKAAIVRELGIEIFIDDREDIIASMQGVIPSPVLFRSWEQEDIAKLVGSA